MAKRIVLHIGRSKTGSTAIQYTMQRNRDLLRRLGFSYLGPGKDLDHRDAHANGQFSNKVARALIEEARAYQGLAIISSEGFQDVDPLLVREWLCEFDVTVLVYLRDQAEAYASGWAQVIHGELETCTLEQYIEWAGPLDYCECLKPWAEAFGKASLNVRIYDRALFPQGDIVADFVLAVGLPHIPELLNGRGADSNPTIAGDLLEAKRQVNAAWGKTAEALRARMYLAIIDLANANPAWRGLTLDAELARRVREQHRKCNAHLAREYLGRDFAFAWERPESSISAPREMRARQK